MATLSDRSSPPAHTHAVTVDDALGFVNTLEYVRGEPVDHLGSAVAALDLLRSLGLVHDEAAGVLGSLSGDEALGRIRRTRGALRELLDATADGRQPAPDAVAELNRALGASEALELVPVDGGLALGHRHTADPIDDALARLVAPIAREVTVGRTERLRVCANDRCRWVFYDASRTGRRRWCDMATCGNRAKAARHRARTREGTATPGS